MYDCDIACTLVEHVVITCAMKVVRNVMGSWYMCQKHVSRVPFAGSARARV